jgi:UDP-glucose 4-epimerase
MAILLTGGAGYIGSHCTKLLKQAGEEVLLLDDLRTGHKQLVLAPLKEAALAAPGVLDEMFERGAIDAVMHFAAYIEAGESVADPAKYYENNVGGAVALVKAMAGHGVRMLVFSSTAAVYGEAERTPIPETHPTRPVNPYGRSKLMVEQMLADAASAYGLRSVSLRYFNAAGADPEGEIGEMHRPESHLVPRLMEIIYRGERAMPVYGNDYATPDGTCIRDYIHVTDLADAHLLALRYLRSGGESNVFNAGSETGYSVMEVLEAAARVTGREPAYHFEPRRPGDAARLVASSAKLRSGLGWQPRYGLDDIIRTAWAWRQRLGDSFRVIW